MGRTRSRPSKYETAKGRVVDAFATHWSKILQSRKDIALDRACHFLAGSESAQMRLARKFYGREHAKQMATLNANEIEYMLSPWLEHALQHYFEFYEDTATAQKYDFLAELPKAEYVSIVHLHGTRSDIEDFPMIDRYPGDRVAYDDLYERLLSGVSCGGVLRIYKSTGERFSRSEARSVRAGIRRELLWGIADDGDDEVHWEFNMDAEGIWDSPGFEDEDFECVIVVEVHSDSED